MNNETFPENIRQLFGEILFCSAKFGVAQFLIIYYPCSKKECFQLSFLYGRMPGCADRNGSGQSAYPEVAVQLSTKQKTHPIQTRLDETICSLPLINQTIHCTYNSIKKPCFHYTDSLFLFFLALSRVCVCIFLCVGVQVSGVLQNTGQSLAFRIDRDTKQYVNISGGPLAYRYQFEEIYIHYGIENNRGSEHTINGYHFPGEVRIDCVHTHWLSICALRM